MHRVIFDSRGVIVNNHEPLQFPEHAIKIETLQNKQGVLNGNRVNFRPGPLTLHVGSP